MYVRAAIIAASITLAISTAFAQETAINPPAPEISQGEPTSTQNSKTFVPSPRSSSAKSSEQWSNSDKIATLSGLVALIALGVSFWQGYLARDHNKRSVTPYLSLDMDTRDGHEINLSLKNEGLGPAIITSMVVRYSNDEYQEPGIEEFRKILRAMGVDIRKNPCTSDIPLTGKAIGAQQTWSVLTFLGSSGDVAHHAKVVAALPSFLVTISYESIYGDKKSVTYSGDFNAEQNRISKGSEQLTVACSGQA